MRVFTEQPGGKEGRFFNRKLFLAAFLVFSMFTASFGQAPAGYYDAANGKSGAELKAALHNIIDDHTEKSYDFLWTVLPESDEDPNNSNNFILIYTGRSIPKTSAYPDYNREHVWAKSHGDFGTTPPAGTDAHHLRPSDVSVNSDRGNKDFDNGGTQHSEATGCYYTESTWEPRDAVKGDIARMMFYMAVRYEGDVSGEPDLELVDYITSPTTNPIFGKLSTLLQWHIDDPVDDFERHRNEVVYSYQENRNPFIDHPEYVDLIWGSGTVSLNFTSTPTTTGQAGVTYTYNVTVAGASGATFDITANAPGWLSLNKTGNGTATLTGTPTEDNVGDNSVVLSVTDGTSSKTQSFTIMVASSIVPLQFTSTPVTSGQVDATYTYNVTLTGNSGSTFTISATTSPSWLTLNSTGNGTATLTGTPTAGDVGPNAVILTGGDGTSTVEQSFTINVAEAASGEWSGETFENMPATSSSYADRSWTGDNNITWTATNARTDLKINNRAICFGKSGTPTLQSQTITGGCSKIRLTYKNPNTATGGVVTIYVNDNPIGTVTPSDSVQTSELSVTNVTSNFVIKITTNGTAQTSIDDLEWQQSSSTNQSPTISNISRNPSNPTPTDNVTVSAGVTDPEGQLSSVVLYYGNGESSLTNSLTMSGNAGTFTAQIPAQASGTVVYYKITATDAANNTTTSSTASYTVSNASGIGNNNTSKSIKVYPNPFSNYLNIETENSGITNVSILNVIGTVISQVNFSTDSYQLNTSGLKAGIYIIKINSNGKIAAIRVVKQ
ncbi:MAG: endonuclease [Bacteroidales bacterium]|nr:endonuclease [Bacteroidales bacterium]